MTKFAFIGFGEAGSLLATGLLASGAKVPIIYDILVHTRDAAPKLIDKARNIGVAVARDAAEVAKDADFVVSAVVSNQTLVAAQSVAPHLRAGQIYFDINSTSPMVKKKAASIIEASGADFVEAAVMDLIPPHGHKAPMLLAGKAAKRIEPILKRYGMHVEAIGDSIGTASTIKMVRSVFLKGFSAILLETLVAASKVGAEDHVLDSLQVTFPQLDWKNLSNYYAARLVKHAERQASEMYAVADTLQDLGIEPLLALASAKRLDWLSHFSLGESSEEPFVDYKALMKRINDLVSANHRP